MRADKQFFLKVAVLVAFIAGSSHAADNNLSIEPEKVQRIMQRSKLLEGQIHVRQKNAQQRNDPTSKQYNIGYSDGYNKAVLDLLKSKLLNGISSSRSRAVTSAPRAITTLTPINAAPVALAEPNSSPVTRRSSTSLSISAPINVPAALVVPSALPNNRVQSAVKTTPAVVRSAAKSAPKKILNKRPLKIAAPKKTYSDFLVLSTASLEAKHWSQAVSYASAALSLQPSSGQALINRSWAYAEQGLLHKALIDANQSIRLLPNNALAYNNRGYTYDLLSDLTRARRDYQRACELNFSHACGIVVKIDQFTENRPQKIAQFLSQSQVKIRQKSWRGLEHLSNKILMLDANNTEALVHRSWSYAEQGRLDDALTDADRAVLLSPDNALAFNNRAYTYELRNNLAKATLDYKRSCELDYSPACAVVKKIYQLTAQKAVKKNLKGSNIQRLINESLVMFREGNWHAVEQLSNEIISLDPNNALAYVNRAGARTEMGLMYNALDDINVALKLNPKLGIAHNNKAYALERIGKMPRAAKSYQRACELGVQQSCQDYRRINIRTTSSRNP